MKLITAYRHGLLLGGTLFAAPALSCNLDQAGLESILAAVNSFEGNVNLHINTNAGGKHDGEDDGDHDSDDGGSDSDKHGDDD